MKNHLTAENDKKTKRPYLAVIAAFLALILTASACGRQGENQNGNEHGSETEPPLEATELPLETAEPYETKENTMGFTVDGNGTVLLDGKPFYGFGVNVFSLVTREVESGTSDYKRQLDFLKDQGIPFIRINFGGYWPSYYEAFDKDPETMLGTLRKIVDYAEEVHVGLVCSLLWHDAAIPTYVGEKRSAMGDPESKTVKYAKEYVTAVVREFKDSPAIWAWEIGNEYNLDADLCDPEAKIWLPAGFGLEDNANGFDYYTSDELNTFLTEVAKAIRAVDPDRMISSGNSDMRSCSKAMHDAGKKMDKKTHVWTVEWNMDSEDDFLSTNSIMAPNPIDCVSFHLQLCSQNEEGEPVYTSSLPRFGRNVLPVQYFRIYADVGKQLKKAVFFGEFGDYLQLDNDERTPEEFAKLLSWISDAGIQIACSWQFSGNSLYVTDAGVDGEKLNLIKTANGNLAAQGKQDVEAYWSRY